TGGALHFIHGFVVDAVVGGHHHGVHQIQFVFRQLGLARFHGAAGNKNNRDIQPHGGHQHTGGDLVTVGDADHGVGAVGVDHVLHRVGDDVAAGQRVEHAVVAHDDAVVHRDGVEFLGDAARSFHFPGHQLAQILQVHVSGHELGEGVGDGDDRLAEITVFHAGGAPQGAGPGHVAAVGGGAGAVLGHGNLVVAATKCERGNIVAYSGGCARVGCGALSDSQETRLIQFNREDI